MIVRTYIDKFNTIIKDSSFNTGYNQVAELIYGADITRILVHFPIEELQNYIQENNITDYVEKMKHRLMITNCGSIDAKDLHKQEDSMYGNGVKLRASSFDLIFFLIPQEWDGGKGYDKDFTYFNRVYNAFGNDPIVNTSKLTSTDGANWFQARNYEPWGEDGVYSNKTLSQEYDNFATVSGSSIVVARQKFDVGNENIEVDLSEVVNKMISGEIPNYGIGIAYSPMMEITESENENYIGFFSHHTHTFFAPYLETKYDNTIKDDRNNFFLDKINRLYLYSNVGGVLTNLDELPTCSVENVPVSVLQASEGVYYVEVKLSSKEYSQDTMYYDVWSNLKYQGELLDDVEMEFVTKGKNQYFNIGQYIEENKKYVPNLYGISADEKIYRGDIRKVGIVSRNEYMKNTASIVGNIFYRLYVKNGSEEIDVIPYERVNQTFIENYFLINTNMLLPQKYFIDIKYMYNLERIIHKNVLSFEVINNKG